MDLLFKRYSDPLRFLNFILKTKRFSEFVDELFAIINEEIEEKTLWELYLHKVFDKSFGDFMAEVEASKEARKPIDFETTIQKSYEILEDFLPEGL